MRVKSSGMAPEVGKCPAPGQCKICKCPTPGTDKVGKCPAVARGGGEAGRRFSHSISVISKGFVPWLDGF